MDTNLYWSVRGNFEQRKSRLAELPKDYLEACVLDREYNDFLRSRADADEKDADHAHILNGKRVPYMGWFWRHLDFHAGRLPLGFHEGYVGFMANNKWDYHERDTTPEEFATIMGFIDAAMVENQKGGSLDKIIDDTNAELKKLRDYVQTLPRVVRS